MLELNATKVLGYLRKDPETEKVDDNKFHPQFSQPFFPAQDAVYCIPHYKCIGGATGLDTSNPWQDNRAEVNSNWNESLKREGAGPWVPDRGSRLRRRYLSIEETTACIRRFSGRRTIVCYQISVTKDAASIINNHDIQLFESAREKGKKRGLMELIFVSFH